MKEFKDIPDYPGYMASPEGFIKSNDRYRLFNLKQGPTNCLRKGRILKPIKTRRGYVVCSITLAGGGFKQIFVHRLIGITFIPNPENKPYINHINGIKTDNRAENLEWCTQLENNSHALATGLKDINSNRKLSNEEVREIRGQLRKGVSGVSLAAKYNVAQPTISAIKTRRLWPNL